MKKDSEVVWLLFAADWPYDRLHDRDFSGLKLKSMQFVPDKAEPSSSESITRVLIAVFLAALMVLGVIALTADGVLIRCRRRAAAPNTNNMGARGEQEVPGPDAPPPQNQPPAAAAGEAAIPGARAAAWKNQLGRTTNTIILVIVCTTIWALYFLGVCQELKSYFEWFKLVPSLQDMVAEELERVHTFENALILKLVCNLQLLIAIFNPELFLFETRVYKVLAAALGLTYSILAIFSMVYLKYWSSFLWGNSQDHLANHCLVAFWSEFCYLIFVFVLLMMTFTMDLLR